MLVIMIVTPAPVEELRSAARLGATLTFGSATPTRVTTLWAGIVLVNTPPPTATGVCAVSEAEADVSQGVAEEATVKPLRLKTWEMFVVVGLMATMAKLR